jgi:hypothetical protein
MSTVTRNDIIAEIQKAIEALPIGTEGISSRELAAALGIHIEKARDIGRLLLSQGKLKAIRIQRPNQFGQMAPQWGYQLPDKPKK